MEKYTEFSCTAGNDVLENSTVADALSGSLVTGSVSDILASVYYSGRRRVKLFESHHNIEVTEYISNMDQEGEVMRVNAWRPLKPHCFKDVPRDEQGGAQEQSCCFHD